MGYIIKANEEAKKRLNLETLEGELFGHNFSGGVAFTTKHLFYRFFKRNGFDCEKISTSEKLERVAIIRLGGLGDLLMTTPVIRALNEKYPGIEINYLIRPLGQKVLVNNPLVKGTISCFDHEFLLYQDQYDEIFELTHTVEENPEAEYRNAYEVALEDVDLKIENKLPEIYFSKEDLQRRDSYLKRYDITKEDKLVIIQIDASSNIRNIEPEKLKKLAKKLVSLKYKVILTGWDTTLKSICDNKKIIDFINLPEVRDVMVMATAGQVKLIVGPDSYLIHVAGALNVKAVVICSSFDPYTRYSLMSTVIPLYKKFRCGPCHMHGTHCVRSIDKIPDCMKNISYLEIEGKVLEVLNDDELKYEWKQYTPPIGECTICGIPGIKKTRKGNGFYFACKECVHMYYAGALDINEYQNKEYFDVYKQARLIEENKNAAKQISEIFPAGGVGRILEIGSGLGHFLKQMQDLGWQTNGIEISNVAAKHSVEKLKVSGITCGNFEDESIKYKKNMFDVIYLSHVFEHMQDSYSALLKMNYSLKKHGAIIIFSPALEYFTNGSWQHINTFFAGEHQNIFSKFSLEKIAKQTGLKLDRYDLIPAAQSHWAVLRKI